MYRRMSWNYIRPKTKINQPYRKLIIVHNKLWEIDVGINFITSAVLVFFLFPFDSYVLVLIIRYWITFALKSLQHKGHTQGQD